MLFRSKELLDQLEEEVSMGRDAAAAQLYYDKVSPCGGYLRQYTPVSYTHLEITALSQELNLMLTAKNRIAKIEQELLQLNPEEDVYKRQAITSVRNPLKARFVNVRLMPKRTASRSSSTTSTVRFLPRQTTARCV